MALLGDKQARLREKAARLYADGRLDAALDTYREVVEADPSELGARLRMADVLRELDRIPEAVEAYGEVAERYATDGLLLKAISVCKSILEIDIGHTRTQGRLAELYARRRRPSIRARADSVREPISAPQIDLQSLVLKPVGPPDSGPPLPSIPLFSNLSKNAFISLLEGLVARRAEEGAALITEGEQGDSFFIVTSGRVRVDKMVESQRMTLAYLHEGAFFGEMALLQEGPRIASVIADVDCEVLEISRELLNEIEFQYPSVGRVLRDFYRDRLLTTTMATHPLFGPFGPLQRRQLMGRFQSRSFDEGEVLIEQGRTGQGLYLALTGALEVITGDDARVLATLGPGDLFGEMSLLGDEPTTATVRAVSECLVLRLSRRAFREVADASPEVYDILEVLYEARRKENEGEPHTPRPISAGEGKALV